MNWQNRDRKLSKRNRNKKQDKVFRDRGKNKDSQKKISYSRLQKQLRRAEQDIEELNEDY